MDIVKLRQHVLIDRDGIVAGFGNEDNSLLVGSEPIATSRVSTYDAGPITDTYISQSNFAFIK